MIQKLLGHENISTTTKSYVAVSNAQKAKALATLEDDVAKNIAKKWKKVKKSDSLAEILGLK
jgi:integrase